MTHDELLARVAQYEEWARYGYTPVIFQALRAVLELHKPDSNYCDACEWQHAYPCPTIQAIEKELL